jgi:hypothetical protein
MAYSESSIDGLLEKFELAAQRQQANKNSTVRLRAAEGDLLKNAEICRNELHSAVAGDKDLLDQVFGGTCERFFRFKNVLTEITFSDMYKNDPRWQHLAEIIDAIEEVLKGRGAFKVGAVGTKPVSGLRYKNFPTRFSPGQLVSHKPEYDGSAATSFEIQGTLPDGLTFNKSNGEIRGKIPARAYVEEASLTVKCSNPAGTDSVSLTFSVGAPPPESVVYDLPQVIYSQEEVNWIPKVEGGTPVEYFIEPPLPEGLKFNSVTGVISGTPVTEQEPVEYTVRASNKTGTCATPFTFGVAQAPPVGLKYDDMPTQCSRGSIIRLNPKLTLQSSVTNTEHYQPLPGMTFSVEPPLPEGFKISDKTGLITGQAVDIVPPTTFTITAQNASGSTSFPLEFSVILKAPKNLDYPQINGELFTGRAVTLTPEVEGGVTEWVCSPNLPAGLEFDSKNGVIHGVPREVTAVTSYTITAKNPDGETSFTVELGVALAPPSGLAYPQQQPVYPYLVPANLHPTVDGKVEKFSIKPQLPAGLELDPLTGVISGTPSDVTGDVKYIVTASNATGSTTYPFTFAVKVMSPTHLRFPGLDNLYYVGEAVTITPEVEGGATEWMIEPALPAGLKMDPKSGIIKGKPTKVTPEPEQGYVVTATNEAGGESEVITFQITAPAPSGLVYNGATDFTVGTEVESEPTIKSGVACTWSIVPDLPEGLVLNPDTGVITGTPTVVTETTNYTVTAKNVTGSTSAAVSFSTSEGYEYDDINHNYAEFIDSVTDIADIGDEPDKKLFYGNWMVWMVHRAWLNDPNLDYFDFTNAPMPPGETEPRVAPKLMKAMEHNTVITSLMLNNSNLNLKQGVELAKALQVNKTLKILNVENNYLDSNAIRECALALTENKESALEQWRFNGQKGVGEFFGRPVEEAVGSMAHANKKIVKLGFSCADAHWNDVCARSLIRNTDLARRARKGNHGDDKNAIPAVQKSLSKVTLLDVPPTAVWEHFDIEDAKLTVARKYLGTQKRMPTKEQLQSYAKAQSQPLKFSEVGPLFKLFRTQMLNSVKDTQVSIADAYSDETIGELRGWREQNERFNFDLWPSEDVRLDYALAKQPVIECSEAFAAWIMNT